jgi:hypothetical protein
VEVLMPTEEIFLERRVGEDVVAVVKTYDEKFAREAFQEMDDVALSALAESLRLDELYERSEIPARTESEFPDFVWETVLDESGEDGSTRSFFVVYRESKGGRKNLLVTPDWPTAESFAAHLVTP